MKIRPFLLALGVAVVILASGIAYLGINRNAPAGSSGAGSDSVWYHASDVALLARTARPQLVEFFHPG